MIAAGQPCPITQGELTFTAALLLISGARCAGPVYCGRWRAPVCYRCRWLVPVAGGGHRWPAPVVPVAGRLPAPVPVAGAGCRCRCRLPAPVAGTQKMCIMNKPPTTVVFVLRHHRPSKEGTPFRKLSSRPLGCADRCFGLIPVPNGACFPPRSPRPALCAVRVCRICTALLSSSPTPAKGSTHVDWRSGFGPSTGPLFTTWRSRRQHGEGCSRWIVHAMDWS